jgi:hypothetical protein
VTARKIAAPPALPPYVAPSGWWARVTLTAELPKKSQYSTNVWFLGEFQGEAVAVEVYDVADIIALRRTLAEHGAARYDSMAYRVDLATAEQVAAARPAAQSDLEAMLPEEERVALRARRLLEASGIIDREDPS